MEFELARIDFTAALLGHALQSFACLSRPLTLLFSPALALIFLLRNEGKLVAFRDYGHLSTDIPQQLARLKDPLLEQQHCLLCTMTTLNPACKWP